MQLISIALQLFYWYPKKFMPGKITTQPATRLIYESDVNSSATRAGKNAWITVKVGQGQIYYLLRKYFLVLRDHHARVECYSNCGRDVNSCYDNCPCYNRCPKGCPVILMIVVNTTLIFLRYLFYIKINKSLLIIDYNKFIVFFFDVLGMYKFVFNTESQL